MDPSRLKSNIAEAKLRVEKLRDELYALEQEVKNREKKVLRFNYSNAAIDAAQVEILQTEYEELNANANTKPFYDHVSFAQDRIRELERMNQLQA